MADGTVAEKAAKGAKKSEPTEKKRRLRSENKNPHTVVSMLYELCNMQRDRRLQPETMSLIMQAYQIEAPLEGVVLPPAEPAAPPEKPTEHLAT